MKLPFLCLAALPLLAVPAEAQRAWGGLPPSQWAPDLSAQVPVEALGAPDVSALLAEDARAPKGALRYAALLPLDVDVDSHGRWDATAGGDLIWRLTLSAPGARTVGLSFSRFELPPGAQLFVSDPDSERFLGSYTEFNNKADGRFQIEPLRGDDLTLELYLPTFSTGEVELALDALIYDYRGVLDLKDGGYSGSGSCNININCPQGAAWQDEKRGVARTLSGGFLCSGSLINNTNSDGTQYFLTANHCGSMNGAVFLFNYETANCNGGGVSSNSVQGSTLLATASSSDYRLVRINENIPASYGVYFPGWDASGSAPANTVSITHPGGDVKKIAIDNNPPTKSGSDWRIAQWEAGMTEGGSSGGPLFDPQGRIIGQLCCGQAFCGFPFNDYYGRMDLSFNGMKPWLAPGSNATSVGGYDPAGGGGGEPTGCDVAILGAGAGGANIGTLSSPTTPQLGANLVFNFSGFSGNSTGTLILSTTQLGTPAFGGTIYANYLNPAATLTVSTVGGAGSTSTQLGTSPTLLGLTGYAQVGILDASQSFGYAFSNGLAFSFCN